MIENYFTSGDIIEIYVNLYVQIKEKLQKIFSTYRPLVF